MIEKIFWTGLVLFLLSGSVLAAWPMHVIDKGGSGADGTDLFDMDGDGDLDVATAWEQSSQVKVYANPNNKTSNWEIIPVCTSRCGAAEDAHFVDLDLDGQMDIVSAQQGGKLLVNWNQGEGTKTYESLVLSIAPTKNWLVVADGQLDAKNGSDLIAGGSFGELYWFESPLIARNMADWNAYRVSSGLTWVMGLVLQDMDGDGDLDVLISDRSKGVMWFENQLSEGVLENWPKHLIGKTCGNASMRWMVVEDLDDDLIKDVIVAESCSKTYSAVTWFKGKNFEKGESWSPWTAQYIELDPVDSKMDYRCAKAVAVGDVDGDEKKDIVVTTYEGCSSQVYWLKQGSQVDETKWAARPVFQLNGTKYDEVQLVDLDNDRDLDVLTSEEKQLGVVWFENTIQSLLDEESTLNVTYDASTGFDDFTFSEVVFGTEWVDAVIEQKQLDGLVLSMQEMRGNASASWSTEIKGDYDLKSDDVIVAEFTIQPLTDVKELPTIRLRANAKPTWNNADLVSIIPTRLTNDWEVEQEQVVKMYLDQKEFPLNASNAILFSMDVVNLDDSARGVVKLKKLHIYSIKRNLLNAQLTYNHDFSTMNGWSTQDDYDNDHYTPISINRKNGAVHFKLLSTYTPEKVPFGYITGPNLKNMSTNHSYTVDASFSKITPPNCPNGTKVRLRVNSPDYAYSLTGIRSLSASKPNDYPLEDDSHPLRMIFDPRSATPFTTHSTFVPSIDFFSHDGAACEGSGVSIDQLEIWENEK